MNQSSVTFDYLPSTLDTSSLPPGAQRYHSVVISELALDPAYWHHIALTVFAEDFAFYVNGTVVAIRALEGRMVDIRRSVFLGQTIDCKFNFPFSPPLLSQLCCISEPLFCLCSCQLLQRPNAGDLFLHTSPDCQGSHRAGDGQPSLYPSQS